MAVNSAGKVQEWWNNNPMDYGVQLMDENKLDVDFFETVDGHFYEMNHPLHSRKGKFDRLFEYGRYVGKPILEIGSGLGTMAMLWATRGADLHAVDLTLQAVRITRRRFELYGLAGDILNADARKLPFENESFDFVYSWGVLHHSPDIQQSLNEMYRVLRPGGQVGVMLYNRRSLRQFYMTMLEGVFHLEDRFLSPLEFNSRYTDGMDMEGNPHTWPVTKAECRKDLFRKFGNCGMRLLGTELDDSFPVMFPIIGSLAPRALKKLYARHFGWSIWITATKD